MAGYGTDDGLEGWAIAQGIILPATANLSAIRQIGSDYLDAAYEGKLGCSRRTEGFAQERAWPRTGHRFNRQAVPSDLIPPAWVNASYRAAYLEALTPGWGTGSTDPNRVVKRQKVDVLEREFFAPGEVNGSSSSVGMTADAIINGMVGPWLCPGGRNLANILRVI